MLNEKEFIQIRKEMQDYDTEREKLIKKSRDVLKLSKQIIYAVHRDDLEEAARLINTIEKEKQKAEEITKHSKALVFEGSYRVSIQEYVEALLYFHFVKDGILIEKEKLNVTSDHYLLGLCDLTGELVRKAVFLAGKGKVDEVGIIKDLVDEIYGELLKFDFREPGLRRKFDSIKYDLRKLEDLVLDLKLKCR
tara:strand:+ start:42 stop:620 length:579 start_codon:yes stop_codon:yes gene_type:complete